MAALAGWATGANPIVIGAVYGAMDGLLHGLAQNKSAGSIVVDTLIGGTIGAATSYGLGVLGKLATGAASKLALTGVGKTIASVSNRTTFKLAASAFDKVNSSFIGKNIVESSVETLISTASALVKDEKLSFDKVATNFISNLVTNSIFNSIGITKNTRAKEDVVEGGGKSKSRALLTYYPPNDGAFGNTEKIFLMPGDKIDRFGKMSGKYFSPVGTPLKMRVLPHNADLSQYRVFEVLKPFEVEESTIAPYFNQLGLGKQFKSPITV